jgi:chitinase
MIWSKESSMNGKLTRWLAMAAMLLAGLMSERLALAQVKSGNSNKVFVGYVYRRPQKVNFGLYTHLCHAFVVADRDGKIRPSQSCPSRDLVAAAGVGMMSSRQSSASRRPKIDISLPSWQS